MKHEKRFLTLLMLATVALFAACEPEITPEPPTPEPPTPETPTPEPPMPETPALTFALELSDVGINTVTMSVTPSDNEAVYVYDVIQQSILDEHHNGAVATYVDNLVAAVMEEYKTPEAVLERIGTQGASSYTYNTLSPDTEHVAFAIAIDAECKVVGEATVESFRTLPMPELCSWEVSFDECFYDGVTFTVTPSDDTIPYYFTVRPSASYGSVMTDEELLENIMFEDGMMLDFYAVTGEYQSLYDMQEFILCSDTGYDLLIFAYSDGAPLTSIKKYPFRTLKPDVESVSFDITVAPTANGADVSVTPSDEHTMYMWDVVDRSELDADYEGNIALYVEAYIANLVEMMGLYELDFSREMGNGGSNFSYAFTPSTNYVVWAAQVDEFGNVVGEIATEEFTTLEEEVPAAAAQMKKGFSLKPRAEAERGTRQ